jgi:Holliday junction resolvase
MTDIEIIKNFYDIKSFLNLDSQEELAKKLQLNQVDLSSRLRGKALETELYLALFLLDSCNHILSFDESTSVLTNSPSPDCLIELKNGFRFFLEVKSKKDRKISIGKSYFDERLKFAMSFGLPLYFAFNLNGYWTLYSSEYIESKERRIDIVDDFRASEFCSYFGDVVLEIPKGLRIEQIFSRNEEGIGRKNEVFGNLIRYTVYYNDLVLYEVDKDLYDQYVLFLLEALYGAMSSQSRQLDKLPNECVVERVGFTESIYTTTHTLLLGQSHALKHELGYMYDTTAFYKSIITNQIGFFKRDALEVLLMELINKGVPIRITNNKEL